MRRKRKNWIILIVLVILFVFIFIFSNTLKISEYNFVNKEIPSSFDSYRIIFLSDFHVGKFFSSDKLKNVIQKTNNLEPDLIVLGGDYPYLADEKDIVSLEEFKKFEAKDGVFWVSGNHDFYSNLKKIFNKSNVTDLNNKLYLITKGNSSIYLAGVENSVVDESMMNELKSIPSEDFLILISHDPRFFEKLKNRGFQSEQQEIFDLGLSGHMHGGQINFFNLWSPASFLENFDLTKRTIKYGNAEVIISYGLGNVYLPFRIFARPEIIVIDLKRT